MAITIDKNPNEWLGALLGALMLVTALVQGCGHTEPVKTPEQIIQESIQEKADKRLKDSLWEDSVLRDHFNNK